MAATWAKPIPDLEVAHHEITSFPVQHKQKSYADKWKHQSFKVGGFWIFDDSNLKTNTKKLKTVTNPHKQHFVSLSYSCCVYSIFGIVLTIRFDTVWCALPKLLRSCTREGCQKGNTSRRAYLLSHLPCFSSFWYLFLWISLFRTH